jgi:hypothetical protein
MSLCSSTECVFEYCSLDLYIAYGGHLFYFFVWAYFLSDVSEYFFYFILTVRFETEEILAYN